MLATLITLVVFSSILFLMSKVKARTLSDAYTPKLLSDVGRGTCPRCGNVQPETLRIDDKNWHTFVCKSCRFTVHTNVCQHEDED